MCCYKTFVLDCDGVVLDSNRLKSLAFFNAALPYGEGAANALLQYHVANGGISRYKKFQYFISSILQQPVVPRRLESLLRGYAEEVRKGLMSCETAAELAEARTLAGAAGWLIVSGGDQLELRRVFRERDLAYLFDRGIFGSPDTKDVILRREIDRGNIVYPAVFLGDSKYDYEVSQRYGLDFVFIYKWTEFVGWQQYCSARAVPVFSTLADAVRQLGAQQGRC